MLPITKLSALESYELGLVIPIPTLPLLNVSGFKYPSLLELGVLKYAIFLKNNSLPSPVKEPLEF